MLIWRILATSPSAMLNWIATRLRSSGVTVVVDAHAVLAAREILGLQLLLGALQQAAVEDAALGQADLLERACAACPCRIPSCRTKSIWAMAGRSCTDTTSTSPSASRRHVLEEAGRVQRADGRGRLVLGHGLADA